MSDKAKSINGDTIKNLIKTTFQIDPRTEVPTIDPYDVNALNELSEKIPFLDSYINGILDLIPSDVLDIVLSNPDVVATLSSFSKNITEIIDGVVDMIPFDIDMQQLLSITDISDMQGVLDFIDTNMDMGELLDAIGIDGNLLDTDFIADLINLTSEDLGGLGILDMDIDGFSDSVNNIITEAMSLFDDDTIDILDDRDTVTDNVNVYTINKPHVNVKTSSTNDNLNGSDIVTKKVTVNDDVNVKLSTIPSMATVPVIGRSRKLTKGNIDVVKVKKIIETNVVRAKTLSSVRNNRSVKLPGLNTPMIKSFVGNNRLVGSNVSSTIIHWNSTYGPSRVKDAINVNNTINVDEIIKKIPQFDYNIELVEELASISTVDFDDVIKLIDKVPYTTINNVSSSLNEIDVVQLRTLLDRLPILNHTELVASNLLINYDTAVIDEVILAVTDYGLVDYKNHLTTGNIDPLLDFVDSLNAVDDVIISLESIKVQAILSDPISIVNSIATDSDNRLVRINNSLIIVPLIESIGINRFTSIISETVDSPNTINVVAKLKLLVTEPDDIIKLLTLPTDLLTSISSLIKDLSTNQDSNSVIDSLVLTLDTITELDTKEQDSVLQWLDGNLSTLISSDKDNKFINKVADMAGTKGDIDTCVDLMGNYRDFIDDSIRRKMVNNILKNYRLNEDDFSISLKDSSIILIADLNYILDGWEYKYGTDEKVYSMDILDGVSNDALNLLLMDDELVESGMLQLNNKIL